MIPKSLRDWTSAPRVIWNDGRIVSAKDDSVSVARIQTALERIGIDPGPIDGVVGWRTRLAHAIAYVRYSDVRVGWWEHDGGVTQALRNPDWLADALHKHGCDFVVLEVAKWDDDKHFEAVATPGEIAGLMKHLRGRGIEPHVMLWPRARTAFVRSMETWLGELMRLERPESVQWDCEGEYFRSRTDGGEDALIALSRRLPVTVGATTYPYGIKGLNRLLTTSCEYLAGQYYEQQDPRRGWNYAPGTLNPGDFGEPLGMELWAGRAAYRQTSPGPHPDWDSAESFIRAIELGTERICYWSGWWCRKESSEAGRMLRRIPARAGGGSNPPPLAA